MLNSYIAVYYVSTYVITLSYTIITSYMTTVLTISYFICNNPQTM